MGLHPQADRILTSPTPTTISLPLSRHSSISTFRFPVVLIITNLISPPPPPRHHQYHSLHTLHELLHPLQLRLKQRLASHRLYRQLRIHTPHRASHLMRRLLSRRILHRASHLPRQLLSQHMPRAMTLLPLRSPQFHPHPIMDILSKFPQTFLDTVHLPLHRLRSLILPISLQI